MLGTKTLSTATLAAPFRKVTLSFLTIETALEDRNLFICQNFTFITNRVQWRGPSQDWENFTEPSLGFANPKGSSFPNLVSHNYQGWQRGTQTVTSQTNFGALHCTVIGCTFVGSF
jgi:hypothetical protein